MQVPRVRLKVRHVMILVAVFAVGLYALDFCSVVYSLSRFPLQVTLKNQTDQAIDSVAVQPLI